MEFIRYYVSCCVMKNHVGDVGILNVLEEIFGKSKLEGKWKDILRIIRTRKEC